MLVTTLLVRLQRIGGSQLHASRSPFSRSLKQYQFLPVDTGSAMEKNCFYAPFFFLPCFVSENGLHYIHFDYF
jgi:hypothetical protein